MPLAVPARVAVALEANEEERQGNQVTDSGDAFPAESVR